MQEKNDKIEELVNTIEEQTKEIEDLKRALEEMKKQLGFWNIQKTDKTNTH